MTICQPVAVKASISPCQRRESTEPTDHTNEDAIRQTEANSSMRPRAVDETSLGHSKTTVPTAPSASPTSPRAARRSPRRIQVSSTRNHIGTEATMSDASPVRTYSSAQQSTTFETLSSSTPMIA